MKKLLLVSIGLTLCSYIFSQSQTEVIVNLKGEKTINICGNSFTIVLNEVDNTAALVDLKYKTRHSPVAWEAVRKFKDLPKVSKTVNIPSSVVIGQTEYTLTTIGHAAFAGYSNAEVFNIPKSVVGIEDDAFYYCNAKQINLPSSLEYIGKHAFSRSGLNGISLPSGVEHIGDSAFAFIDMKYLEIASPIEYIGTNAFLGCKKMERIVLPNSELSSSVLFPDSKKAVIQYAQYGNNNIVTRPIKKKKEKITDTKDLKSPKVYATTSDVDVNIPVTTQSNNETFVVIIANENYEKEAKVECAHNDGRTFMKYCQNALGVPQTNIRYIEDATLGNMMEEVNWLSNIAKVFEGDAKIIIYYAGHGIPSENNGDAFLLPVDVAGNNTAGAYNLNKLYSALGGLNAKNITVFIDACFSGSKRGDGMLTSARGVAIKVKHVEPSGNMVVFSAATDDETAYPYAEKGHGLFTYFLLKKLQETKGDVDFGTLSEYVRKEVSRRSIVVNSKPQTPTVTFSSQISNSWKSFKLR